MWLPPSLAEEQHRERSLMEHMFDVYETVEHFNAQLHSIDPDLELVKAKDRADDTLVPGLKPGYWHLLRREGMAATILPLEHPDGSPRDPGSWMFDYLQENDMWNDRAMNARRKRALQLAGEKERAEERNRQARVGEINERIHTMESPSVSFANRGSWTNKAGARRA